MQQPTSTKRPIFEKSREFSIDTWIENPEPVALENYGLKIDEIKKNKMNFLAFSTYQDFPHRERNKTDDF